MALIILEGLDRTGKSSVAQYFQDKGFEIVHMSAPPKGTLADAYMGEMVDLLTSFAGRDVILDRSHYGELIWPNIYGRKPLLEPEDIDALREIEDTLGCERILMHDPNVEAHWKRCVDNKEPLTKAQFVKARSLYNSMADNYGFTKKTLGDFPEAAALSNQVSQDGSKAEPAEANSESQRSSEAGETSQAAASRTPQQTKLDKANAINDVLSKRIIKGKGLVYDDLERMVRGFLNTELGKLFGQVQPQKGDFSPEEVQLLKFFCERLKSKEN